jgi:predicted transglutaminase-like cysteine proteinase
MLEEMINVLNNLMQRSSPVKNLIFIILLLSTACFSTAVNDTCHQTKLCKQDSIQLTQLIVKIQKMIDRIHKLSEISNEEMSKIMKMTDQQLKQADSEWKAEQKEEAEMYELEFQILQSKGLTEKQAQQFILNAEGY